MGYTHYWSPAKKIPKGKIKKAIGVMGKIVEDNAEILAGAAGHGEPLVMPEGICFNGQDDESHETFGIESDWDEPEFCKTERKEYDDIVVACLVVLKHFLGTTANVSSDGDKDDWAYGLSIAMKYVDDIDPNKVLVDIRD